jgi:hypothetical protein
MNAANQGEDKPPDLAIATHLRVADRGRGSSKPLSNDRR